MKLKALTLNDRKMLYGYLALQRHELSVYALENIYIWSGLFDIRWTIIEDDLCVFFRDSAGSFLYVSPLGRRISAETVKKIFGILDRCNRNTEISRIENIEECDAAFYRNLGYACMLKSHDYVYRKAEVANFKGNKFKSPRASYNYFTKHYQCEYLPFSLGQKKAILQLYEIWKRQRKNNGKDALYQGMLEDSQNVLSVMLENYRRLQLTGRIVKIKGEIKAFTFGFKLNDETFCILYEVTDLSVKGLSQFIFREFCRELEGYAYINVMDDSGLENLKVAKLSYHPAKLIPAYIVTKPRDGSRSFS